MVLRRESHATLVSPCCTWDCSARVHSARLCRHLIAKASDAPCAALVLLASVRSTGPTALAPSVLARLQVRDSLSEVTIDSRVDVVPRLGDAGGKRVQGRAFLAVECVGLGSGPPGREKDAPPNALAVDALVKVETPAAGGFIAVDRHAAL